MNTYDTWVRRATTDPAWTYGTIRQFVNAIVPRSAGCTRGGARTNITPDEAVEIIRLFELRRNRDGGPLVESDQAKKGRDWLSNYHRRLGLRTDIDYQAITEFRLSGFDVLDETSWRMVVAPIYTAYWPDGTRLTYTAIPWQSGGSDRHDFRWQEAA